MNRIKKTLTIISIATLVGAVGMLIASVFGFKAFSGTSLSILLSLAVLCLGSTLLINAVSIFNKKKNIAIINISLLAISIVLGLILIWVKILQDSIFQTITMIFVLATVLLNIIVSNYIKLGKSLLVLQVFTYILISIIDIILSLYFLKVDLFKILPYFTQIFIVICLVTFILLVTLAILSKKIIKEDVANAKVAKDDGEFMQIKKADYDAMVEKIAKLEKELKELNSAR